jgi:putative ABC transport system substrate-binding protein
LPDLETAARTLGQNIRVLDASTKSQINAAFKKLPELRADALIVISDAFLNEQTEQIAALASAFSIPAIAARCEFAASGLLLSYGPSCYRGVASGGHLHRSDTQGRKAGRPARIATDPVRARHQPANRQGTRP